MGRAENRPAHVTGKGSGRGTDGLTPNRPGGLPKPAGATPSASKGSAMQKSGTTGKGSSRGSKSPGNDTGSKMARTGGYGPLTGGKR